MPLTMIEPKPVIVPSVKARPCEADWEADMVPPPPPPHPAASSSAATAAKAARSAPRELKIEVFMAGSPFGFGLTDSPSSRVTERTRQVFPQRMAVSPGGDNS